MATSAERLAEYEKLFDVAQSYDPTAYQKEFEKTYNENMNYNQDLINQQSTALAELQNIAPTLRQKYASSLIKDPTLQRSLISSARQTPITDYSNATNLLTARGNKYSDILASALGAYQTAADKAQAAAESAWNMYTQQVAIEEAAKDKAASSSGLSLADLLATSSEEDTSSTEDEGTYEIPESSTNWTEKITSPITSIINSIQEAKKTAEKRKSIESSPVYLNSDKLSSFSSILKLLFGRG